MSATQSSTKLTASENEAFEIADGALIGARARITCLRRRSLGGTSMRLRVHGSNGETDEHLNRKACTHMAAALREHLPLLSTTITQSEVDGEDELQIDLPMRGELKERARRLSGAHLLPRILCWLASVLSVIGVVLCGLAEMRALVFSPGK